MLQNALIKLLADHYTVDNNVQQDSFVKICDSSSIQAPVSIKNQKLGLKSRNLKYFKKYIK